MVRLYRALCRRAAGSRLFACGGTGAYGGASHGGPAATGYLGPGSAPGRGDRGAGRDHGAGGGPVQAGSKGYKGPAPTQTVKLRVMRQAFDTSAEELWKGWYSKFTEAYPNVTFAEEIVPTATCSQAADLRRRGRFARHRDGKGDFVQSYVFNKIALPWATISHPST